MTDQVSGSSAFERILPIRDRGLFGGQVEVFAFGKPYNYGIYDELKKKPVHFLAVAQVAKKCGVTKVYVPIGSFNGRVITPEPDDFKTPVEMDGVTFYFDYNDGRADGVRLLEPSTGYFVGSGDCPVTIIRLPNGTVVAAHTGRDSVIEPEGIFDPTGTRYRSVVFSALEGWYGRAQHVRAAVLFGIQPQSFQHRFDDPVHGKKNKAMVERLIKRWGPQVLLPPISLGQISFTELVKAQLEELGAPVDSMSFRGDPLIDTATDPELYSNRRGDKERTGVLVVRCA